MSKIRQYAKNSNIKLTKDFNAKDFDCKCGDCKITVIDLSIVEELQRLKNETDPTVKVLNGYKCAKYNALTKEANDAHVKGLAVDLALKINDIQNLTSFDGIGFYNAYTHLDRNKRKISWDFRTKNLKNKV